MLSSARVFCCKAAFCFFFPCLSLCPLSALPDLFLIPPHQAAKWQLSSGLPPLRFPLASHAAQKGSSLCSPCPLRLCKLPKGQPLSPAPQTPLLPVFPSAFIPLFLFL
ncbi:hypothetical protein ACFX1R_010105 [Malus domestica]